MTKLFTSSVPCLFASGAIFIIYRHKRSEVNSDKPDIMYFTPEVYNSQNYLITVDAENVNACKRLYTENCPDYADGIEELVQLIKPHYLAPANANDALRLYCEIIDVLKNC